LHPEVFWGSTAPTTPRRRFGHERLQQRGEVAPTDWGSLGACGVVAVRRGKCWWKSGPKGGRRHNSPLSSLPPFGCLLGPLLLLVRGKGTLYLIEQQRKQGNTQQTEDRLSCGSLRCSLLITVCPFHYKGFTIYRRPLGIVICLNYTFSIPDKPL
jgi:hypothetical protein